LEKTERRERERERDSREERDQDNEGRVEVGQEPLGESRAEHER
jgi:hypothetical protein